APSKGTGFFGFRSRALACAVLSALGTAMVAGCGPGNESNLTSPQFTGGNGPGGAGGDGGAGGSEACPQGAARDCHLTLGEHQGVLSCFDGTETCTNGAWGPCEGSEKKRPLPPRTGRPGAGAPEVKSLSVPSSCMNNPCDPSCQTFDEVPGAPVGSP